MNQPVIFVGGVHGAGKSTLCRRIAALLRIEHVSAGSLIRAAASATDVVTVGIGNKAVPDMDANQERLLRGLHILRAQGGLLQRQKYGILLDGHFCLLDPAGCVKEIPPFVFEEIDPVAVLLVEAGPEIIVRRLSARDGDAPSIQALAALASRERAHAITVCIGLGIPLYNALGDAEPDEAAQFAVLRLRPHLNKEDA